jgi:hypothetical protein
MGVDTVPKVNRATFESGSELNDLETGIFLLGPVFDTHPGLWTIIE